MISARIVLVGLFSFAALAGSGGAQAADIAAGRAKAQLCAACHGEDGVSRIPLMPSLAGQQDVYLQWQLVYFRSGARKSQAMQLIAGQLTNEDIRNLGAYYASLKPPKPAPTGPNDALAQKGKLIASQQHCSSCHHDHFEGYLSDARLASQREEVLLKALRDFKSGKRVGSGVASMGDAVYPLDDDDMKALAHFLATQP